MTEITPSFQNVTPPDITVLLEALKREIKKEINCAKVGVIQSWSPSTNTVVVKIAQQQVTSVAQDGTRTLAEYPLLLTVPVAFPGGGGFTLTFPIAVGDECLVVFNDRELDNWFSSGAGLPPTTARIHDISDGVAFVGLRSSPRALASISSSTTQLRSDDGTTFVEIAGGGIINAVAPTSINFTTPVLNVTGDVVAGTISLKHHIHSGVQTGGGNSGQPVP
jgi:Phage protein Gp138 N-terminal domain/GpV Apex motif